LVRVRILFPAVGVSWCRRLVLVIIIIVAAVAAIFLHHHHFAAWRFVLAVVLEVGGW
jgi:hypothetical protein